MADKRTLEKNPNDGSPTKRVTRSLVVTQTKLQKDVATMLNTGKKSTTKSNPVFTQNIGPSPSTGAVRKGTQVKATHVRETDKLDQPNEQAASTQAVAQDKVNQLEQLIAASSAHIDATQHSLPDDSDVSYRIRWKLQTHRWSVNQRHPVER